MPHSDSVVCYCVVYTVVSASSLTVTVEDVLRALQSNSSSSSSSSNNNNITTSSTDERMNHSKSLSWLMEAASGSNTEELATGPISDWLNQLASNEGRTSSASLFVSSSILSHFIQQVRLTCSSQRSGTGHSMSSMPKHKRVRCVERDPTQITLTAPMPQGSKSTGRTYRTRH